MLTADRASGSLGAALRLFGEPIRLRILALLELEELSVGELSRALGLAQSRVSNHLRLLREAGLLAERHAGKSTHLRLAAEARAADANGGAAALELWTTLRERVSAFPEHSDDLGRLEVVLGERARGERDFFDRVAVDWDKIGQDFETGQARQRAAASLLPRGLVLADLGCGTGYAARALCGLCARLVLVDRSSAMLARAKQRLANAPGGTELDMRRGELDALPIASGELDGLVAGMVLHHLPDLEKPLAEMRRVLKPGAAAVLFDLVPHGEAWMHEAQGDRLLGVDPADVLAALERRGFEEIALETPDDRYVPRAEASETSTETDERARLPLFLVRARVPA